MFIVSLCEGAKYKPHIDLSQFGKSGFRERCNAAIFLDFCVKNLLVEIGEDRWSRMWLLAEFFVAYRHTPRVKGILFAVNFATYQTIFMRDIHTRAMNIMIRSVPIRLAL